MNDSSRSRYNLNAFEMARTFQRLRQAAPPVSAADRDVARVEDVIEDERSSTSAAAGSQVTPLETAA